MNQNIVGEKGGLLKSSFPKSTLNKEKFISSNFRTHDLHLLKKRSVIQPIQ